MTHFPSDNSRKINQMKRMMPWLRNALLSLVVAILAFPRPFYSQEANYLTIQASISPKRLSRGQEGKVVLKFVAKKGITISPYPAFTIAFSSSEELAFPKNFFSASDLDIEIQEVEGKEYLNLQNPVEIPFTVMQTARQGTHLLKGKVTYFAYSSEGWCLKTTSKFSASFYTSARLVKK